MDFFNKTKDSLLNAGNAFSQKAGNVSGAANLMMKIHEEEKKMQTCIADLGKIMMEQHPEETQKMCPEIFFQIQELAKQTTQDKNELAICKGMKICPNCGAEQQAEVMNCTVCGMNMQETEKLIRENHP